MDEPDEHRVVKIIVRHYRYPADFVFSLPVEYCRKHHGFIPATKGGLTRVILIFENGSVAHGSALCSKKDNFNYAIGRELATKRAYASVGFKSDPHPSNL